MCMCMAAPVCVRVFVEGRKEGTSPLLEVVERDHLNLLCECVQENENRCHLCTQSRDCSKRRLPTAVAPETKIEAVHASRPCDGGSEECRCHRSLSGSWYSTNSVNRSKKIVPSSRARARAVSLSLSVALSLSQSFSLCQSLSKIFCLSVPLSVYHVCVCV